MGGANGSRECAPDDKLRDTHQLHFMKMMGFAGAQPILRLWRTSRNIVARMERSEIRDWLPNVPHPHVAALMRATCSPHRNSKRSPDGAKRNPGFTRHRSRIALRSIRACMGTWLSRGVSDQGMLFPRSVACSAMRS